MALSPLPLLLLLLLFGTALCAAQRSACPSANTAPLAYATPAVAAGYTAHRIASGLSRPRSVVIDDRGQLLVSGSEQGVVGLVLDAAGCGVERTVVVVASDGTGDHFNHGLALSPDGKTLYASTSGSAFSWSYDSSRLAATNRRELVSGMSSAGHITRTLLVPSRHADLLLISRGSNSNLDAGTTSLASGRSMIKVFNTTAIGTGKPADYTRDGVVLGWGLRNSVGVAENPADGGIWSVENSADQVTRYGVDFHRDNPGEELNYHGGLDGIPEEAANYGYPSCVAVYDPTAIPRAGSLSIGSQFALAPNETSTDATCNSDLFRSPRLTFAAHTAPLSLAFNGSTSAFVAFHGSWNRDDPVGYHVAVLDFSDDGQPRKTSGEKDPETRVMWNEDLGSCPDACFRPAGVAVGREGQVFVTADSTGDLWVLTRERESATGRDQSAVSKRCTARSEVVLAVVLGMAVWNGLL